MIQIDSIFTTLRHTLVASLLLVVSTTAFSAEKQTVTDAVDALVSLLVDTDANEYPEARKIHHIGDNSFEVVLFTLEGFKGGNNYTYYLAVFEPEWELGPDDYVESMKLRSEDIVKYRFIGYLPVGGKAWRHIDFDHISVEGRLLTLQTKEYARGDGACCPSIPATAAYKIDEHQITEVKNQ